MTERTRDTETTIDEIECPGHFSDAADDFVVHQVADTHKGGSHRHGNGQTVENPKEIDFVLPTIVYQETEYAHDSTMARKPLIANKMTFLVYRQQNLQRMGDKHFRFIKQKMPQSQTHNRPNNGPNRDLIQQFL